MIKHSKVEQLKKISLLFEEEMKGEIENLTRLKKMIDTRVEAVNRVILYKNEYQNKGASTSMSSVPALMRNFQEFVKKIDDVIQSETAKIDMQQEEKIVMIDNIQKIEHKIKALEVLIEKLTKNILIQDEERLLAEADELSMQAKIRERI